MQLAEVVEEYEQLPPEDQQEFQDKTAPLDRVSQKARDRLYLIVVVAFSIVMVGAFVTLAIGVFAKGVRPEIILTTFTSVVGFLAGLFVPSPAAK